MVDIKFLIEAIQTNNIELVKDLVEKQGADINYFDGSTKNPLFQSIFDKNEEILEYLLSKGANPNIRTKGFGKTPLYEALSGRFDKGVEILLKYHADPNIYDKAYVSPLRLGLRSPNQMILKKLLDAGAKDTTINSVFDFIKSPDVIDLLASYNITPQNNQLIDLQKQRNVYFYKNELYRKLNWRTKTYRQKSEDKYINNIKDTYGNKDDTLICIGDWSNKNTIKGLASTMGIGLKRLIAKKFNTVLVYEYNTSKKCCNCHHDIDNKKINGNSKFRLLQCEYCNVECFENSNESTFRYRKYLNRDQNSCANMLNIVKSYLFDNRRRPPAFCK